MKVTTKCKCKKAAHTLCNDPSGGRHQQPWHSSALRTGANGVQEKARGGFNANIMKR